MATSSIQQPASNGSSKSHAVAQSMKLGAAAGFGGLVFGGVKGVLSSHPRPGLHSIAHGIYWSSVAIPYWLLRANVIKYHYSDEATPTQRIYASAAAGAVSGGTISSLLGANRRFMLGAVTVATLASIGQFSYDLIDEQRTQNLDATRVPLLQRIAGSRWSPLRVLSDEEYAGMLKEKLLAVDTEIALIDDKIQEVKGSAIADGKKK